MTRDSAPKTILITGGCGFIGTNLVKYLSERGCRLTILDNLSTSSRTWIAHDKKLAANPQLTKPTKLSQSTQQTTLTLAPGLSAVDLEVGDIEDSEAVEKAVEEMNIVVHLAAHTSVVDSLKNPKKIWDVNVNGTLNVLEACRRKGADMFIFASSNGVVGEQTPPIDELRIPRPLSPYGASKLAGEALCSAYYRSFGLNTICLRFANCYGPYSENKASVINSFLKRARQGRPFVIYGDGNQTRDFVHVDDVCQAIHLCLMSGDHRLSTAERIAGEVFQIASGVETSINELAEIMKEIIESNPPTADFRPSTIHKPKRKGEIERNYSDIAKAKRMLGFEPKIGLREGLKELCQLRGAKPR